MSSIIKTWKSGLVASLAAFLFFSFFSSGCALLWLSAGGAGGYLIRKGEEGDGPKKKETSETQNKSSVKQVERKAAYALKRKGEQEPVLELGGVP